MEIEATPRFLGDAVGREPLACLEDVRVLLGPDTVVFWQDQALVPESYQMVRAVLDQPPTNHFKLDPAQRLRWRLPDAHAELNEAFLVGQSHNFFHFLVEHAANLATWARHPQLVRVPQLALPHSAAQAGFLTALGATRPVLEQHAVVRRLHIAAPAFDREAALLRANFPAWARGRAGHGTATEKLYLARRSGARQVSNEPELEAALHARGFRTVRAETLSAREQIAAFAAAAVVVAPHGAGLANLLWAPPGCRVVELWPRQGWKPTFFVNLCAAMGLRHSKIVGEDGRFETAFAVDVAAVLAAAGDV